MLVFWSLFSLVAPAQVTMVSGNFEQLVADAFVGHDNFGFRYFIKNNVFCKQKSGVTLEYKNLALGKITRVDLRNPLQIVLFYEGFNTAVLVDNQLNETHRINFSKNATPIVASAVAMASGNRLWIFNTLSQKVGLFDYLRNELRELTVPFTGKVSVYESDFNHFHWIDDQGNHYATDVYGKITTFEPMAGIQQFVLANDAWLLYAKDGKIYARTAKNDKSETLPIGEKTFKSFHYQAQILSIFTEQGITNYKITLP
ncbi:NHL repeat-containing protein [Flavobacterium caeni]|uniref:Uncharacterized protein n=1 Tax=Flavobacterium caeni TaxID=490189 RepID=A0A1G5JS08_9FLAO|nr:hypothetical protein [Flavobacterium caeni]SCY91222.1 hypothetical protein SAMN02927903_02859 [Flavobacterium caeni]